MKERLLGFAALSIAIGAMPLSWLFTFGPRWLEISGLTLYVIAIGISVRAWWRHKPNPFETEPMRHDSEEW